ncbi:MFS transporter [Nocardioides bruguierae]|uniref:MFS transporter n=1 Tax=Nocardioides bruguierae TaxID=2945102 RepID=A0A9X2D5M9_9ACTN|nr:MFS transporter [Nocardioides bruguierae]MCM0619277.1 MFS transporter [Nocardioides bruguierae]
MPVVLACFVTLLLSNMASPVYPLWQAEMGFDEGVINLLFAVYPGGVLAALLTVRALGRRVDAERLLPLACTLGLLSSAGFLVASGPWLLGVARLVCGLSVGLVLSCGASAMTGRLEARGVPRAPRVAGLILSAGFACGSIVAGLLADHAPAPTRLVFAVEAVGLVAVLALLLGERAWVGRRLAAAPAPAASPSHESAGSTGPADVEEEPAPAGPPMVPEHLRRTALLMGVAVMISCGVAAAVFQSIGSAYLRDLLGDDSATVAGLLVFIVFAGAFTGQLVLAGAPTLAQAWTALGCGFGGAVLLLVGVLTDQVVPLFVAAVGAGAAQGLSQSVALTTARRTCDLTRLTGVLAVFNILGYGTAGLTIALSSPLVTAAGAAAGILVIASGVAVATALASGVLLRWRGALSEAVVLPAPSATGNVGTVGVTGGAAVR